MIGFGHQSQLNRRILVLKLCLGGGKYNLSPWYLGGGMMCLVQENPISIPTTHPGQVGLGLSLLNLRSCNLKMHHNINLFRALNMITFRNSVFYYWGLFKGLSPNNRTGLALKTYSWAFQTHPVYNCPGPWVLQISQQSTLKMTFSSFVNFNDVQTMYTNLYINNNI